MVGTGPGPNPPTPELTLQPVQPGAQQLRRVGVVLQQLGVLAKADQKRQILLTQYASEKLIGRVLLDLDQVHLAGADVDEQPDGERQIGLAIEILDLLLLAVFEDVEVVLIEIADQAALLIAER